MVKTPESVPSLAELSRASTESESINRVLFRTPEPEALEVLLGYSHSLSGEEDDKDPLFGSDISIASEGDNTIVDSENDSPYAGQGDMLSPLTPCIDNRGSNNDGSIQTYCHAGFNLSPRELAGMFNIFDDSQKSDSLDMNSPTSIAADSGTDAVTEVTSNIDHSTISWERKIDSLKRECATLKEIIKGDSVKILQLKAELASLHQVQSKYVSKSRPEPGASALKRERDTLLHKESQYIETIKALKEKMSALAKAQGNSSIGANKELEQLRLQNELFAAQIIENETELRAARSIANELAEEKATLIQKLAVEEKYNPAATKSQQDATAFQKSSAEMLEAQIASLAAKIADIESDRERRDREFKEENRQTHDDLESIKAMILPSFSNEGTPSKDSLVVSVEDVNKQHVDNNEVEVTLEGMIIAGGSNPQEDAGESSDKDKVVQPDDEIGGFCDCFPSLSREDEE